MNILSTGTQLKINCRKSTKKMQFEDCSDLADSTTDFLKS